MNTQALMKITAANRTSGSIVHAIGDIVIVDQTVAAAWQASGVAQRLDTNQIAADLTTWTKNGTIYVALTGTTPVTISLADLTSNASAYCGDTSFATWNQIVVANLGAADVAIAPASSNPATIQVAGTTPTVTVAANSTHLLHSAAGITVNSTHKSITITPTAGGAVSLTVGGS